MEDSMQVESINLTTILDKRREVVSELEKINSEFSDFLTTMGSINIEIEPLSIVKLEGFLKEDWDIYVKLDYFTTNLRIKMNTLKQLL